MGSRQCDTFHALDRDSIGTAGRSQSSQGWTRIKGLRPGEQLSSRAVPHSVVNGRMCVGTSTQQMKREEERTQQVIQDYNR